MFVYLFQIIKNKKNKKLKKWVNTIKWVVNPKIYLETAGAPTLILAISSQLIMASFL